MKRQNRNRLLGTPFLFWRCSTFFMTRKLGLVRIPAYTSSLPWPSLLCTGRDQDFFADSCLPVGGRSFAWEEFQADICRTRLGSRFQERTYFSDSCPPCHFSSAWRSPTTSANSPGRIFSISPSLRLLRRAVGSRLRIRPALSPMSMAGVAGDAAYRGSIWLGACRAGRQFFVKPWPFFFCWAAGACSLPGFITAGIPSGSPGPRPCLMNFYWELFSVQQDRTGGMVSVLPAMDHDSVAALLTWKATRKQSAAQVSV